MEGATLMALSSDELREKLQKARGVPENKNFSVPVLDQATPSRPALKADDSVSMERKGKEAAVERTADSRGAKKTVPQSHGNGAGAQIPPGTGWSGKRRQKKIRDFANPRKSGTPDIHRAPPHSVEAEMGVLGSMIMSSRTTIAEVVAQAKVEWFYVPAHCTIYSELVAMWDKGQAVDLITFTEHLRTVGHLDDVGGPAFVTRLFTFVPTSANVAYYLEIVRDKYLLREVIQATTESCRRAYEEQDEVNTLLDELEQKFINLGGDNRCGTAINTMPENVSRAFEIMEAAYARKGSVTGIETGFAELDRMTGGLQNSEMIVIAARPSMGKTALCMNIAEYAGR
jgi:hypothetical protein